MPINSVTREECLRVHQDLNERLQEVNQNIKDANDNVKTIRENDLQHLNDKIDAQNNKLEVQWKWIALVAIISGFALGIKLLEIARLIT